MDFNDIANGKYNRNFNDNDAFNKGVNKEVRSDSQNEELATLMMEKLGESNLKPFLAVSYSGIPRGKIERFIATANEVGSTPVKLFMHLVGREKLWQDYQEKKRSRGRSNER